MARQTPLPRFRLETDSLTDRSFPDIRAASASPNMPQLHERRQQQPPPPPPQLQTQRSQNRIRRSACSDLQSTAIPEERVYNGNNRRRASLFVGRPSQQTVSIPKNASCDKEPTERDYVKLCRLKCQSLYGSLANSTITSPPISPLALSGDSFAALSDDDDDDDDDEEENENEEPDEEEEEEEQQQHYQTVQTNNFRHSLPDTSPSGLAIRNFLKRNKTTNYHHRLGLPTHSSQSLYSSTSSSSSSTLPNSSSPLSTFRNFLSLVKLPSTSSSTKSINSTASTTPHHSSLTTLTSATGGSSTTLDQATSSTSSKKRPTTSIDTQYQWHFEVSTHTQ